VLLDGLVEGDLHLLLFQDCGLELSELVISGEVAWQNAAGTAEIIEDGV
jgi:hypothetical protein